jgi:ABC-type Fe3+ transport system permease subunit
MVSPSGRAGSCRCVESWRGTRLWSLDAVWTPIDSSVLITAGILLLALRVRFAYTLRRIVQRLRSKYPILSDDLGRPIPGIAVGISVSVLFLVLASIQYQRFSVWLIRGTYHKLNDEEITRLAGRLKSYGIIYAAGYVALLGYAVLRLSI